MERFQAQIGEFLNGLDFDDLAENIRQDLDTDFELNILGVEGNPLDGDFVKDLSDAIIENVFNQLDESLPGLADLDFASDYSSLIKESILDKLDQDVLDDDFAKNLSENIRTKVLAALSESAVDPTGDDFARKLKAAILSKLNTDNKVDLSRFLDGSFVDGLTETVKENILLRFAGGNPLGDDFAKQTAAEVRRKIDESFSETGFGSPFDAEFANKVRLSVLKRVTIGIKAYDPCELVGGVACGEYTSEQLLDQLLPGLDSLLDDTKSDLETDIQERVSKVNDMATNLADTIRNNVVTLVEDIKSRSFGDFNFDLDNIFDAGYWDNFAAELKEEILADIDGIVVEAGGAFAGVGNALDGLLNDIKDRIKLTIDGIAEVDI